jgi:predicted dehydrogenase
MSNVGAAVIGTGFMCWVHIEALRRIGVPVVGLLGSSEPKSEKAAARFGVSRAYRSLDELLADPLAESVHVATPNRFHFEMVRRALEAGKHVMCEKPLAMNTRESTQLVELAENHPRQCSAVNYNVRYYPLCLEAAERCGSGELGEIFHVSGSYVQDWLLLPTDYNWRVSAEQGGPLRAVADIGTHWFDLIHAITGLEIEAVCADLKTFHSTRYRPRAAAETFQSESSSSSSSGEPVRIDTEDYGAILLRFRGGARGSVVVSQVSAGRKNCLRVEIAGARQALAFDSEHPNELWIGHRDRPNQTLLRDPSLLSPAARTATSYPGGHNEGYADTFKQCFRRFYESVRTRDFSDLPQYPTFSEGHREILLCEAIQHSARHGAWVNIPGASP